MFDVKKPIVSTKNFVSKHRVGIAVIATAIPLVALQQRNLRVFNEFLKEKGLYEEYYTPEDSY